MNAAHLHLVLNHIPVLGTVFGLGLLAFGLLRRSEDVERVALGLLVVTALFAVPAYLTGEPAEDAVESRPGVARGLIEQHEAAAGAAFVGMLVLGGLALVGGIGFRGRRPIPAWFGGCVLLGALIVSGMMAWTAKLGGQVSHPEIRAGMADATLFEPDHD